LQANLGEPFRPSLFASYRDRRTLANRTYFPARCTRRTRANLPLISDACAAVDAKGFLLACSTQPSSTVVRRLEEIEKDRNIVTRYWDSIEIEKRLDAPSTFPLISIFLPKGSAAMPWKIYNSTRPSFWAATEPYMDNFRIGHSREGSISEISWAHVADE
jgi:hypothetical protein